MAGAKGLRKRGMPPEDIARALDDRFRDRVGPGRFDAADIAAGKGWWRDQQIQATGRTNWKGIAYSAEEMALARRMYAEHATYRQILDAITNLSGRPFKDANSAAQVLRSAGIERTRKTVPTLGDLWTREANVFLYELNKRGETPQAITRLMNSFWPVGEFTSQLVREQPAACA